MITDNSSLGEVECPHLAYRTGFGSLYIGDSEQVLNSDDVELYRKKVNLIFTSPPFPLNRKKAYGNKNGQDYIDWLAGYGSIFKEMLVEDGSIVIEIGNAWEKGNPTMSTLSIESLLEFKKRGNFHLCQEFILNNPARLPSPIQWVNKERIRVKDSFTRFWWLSPNPKPKADNRHVLVEYSPRMKNLLHKQKYNSGIRPSQHKIGSKSFLHDNGGAIPTNVITATNTLSKDPYLTYCKEHKIKPHPARMPPEVAAFFIKFLTDEGDLVLDPFSGSNITGHMAEQLKRNWLCIERQKEYADGSIGRFVDSPSYHLARRGSYG